MFWYDFKLIVLLSYEGEDSLLQTYFTYWNDVILLFWDIKRVNGIEKGVMGAKKNIYEL
jgi:hypothetical protein